MTPEELEAIKFVFIFTGVVIGMALTSIVAIAAIYFRTRYEDES